MLRTEFCKGSAEICEAIININGKKYIYFKYEMYKNELGYKLYKSKDVYK